MKVTVLYGENIEASRKRFFEIIDTIRKRGWEIVRLSGSEDLGNSIASISLFESERLFVLEDIQKTKREDLIWLAARKIDANLLIWNKGSVPVEIRKILPRNTRFEEYKIPKKIFQFLDSFYPGNHKQALNLFHQVIKNETPEFVVAMLSRQLRDIYLAKNDFSLLAYPKWKNQKLRMLSERFSIKKLIKIINLLSQADFDSKTGKTDLVLSIDLIIVEELE